MLDLSIWEILIVLAVSVVILKPEDFPKVLRSIGHFFAKIKELSDEIYSLIKEEEQKPRSAKIIGEDGLEHIAYDVEDVYGEEFGEIEVLENRKQEEPEKPNSLKKKVSKSSS